MRSAHRAFREALVSKLLKDPLIVAPKRLYITKNTPLPTIRLTRPFGIYQQVLGKRAAYVFCQWSRVTKKGITLRTISRLANVQKKKHNL